MYQNGSLLEVMWNSCLSDMFDGGAACFPFASGAASSRHQLIKKVKQPSVLLAQYYYYS
jgi:hypothetical protein